MSGVRDDYETLAAEIVFYIKLSPLEISSMPLSELLWWYTSLADVAAKQNK